MDEHREAVTNPWKGRRVQVIAGPFAGFVGTVVAADEPQRQIEVVVPCFGRETVLRLDVLQVEAAP